MLSGKAEVIVASQLQAETDRVCTGLIADCGRIPDCNVAAHGILI